MTLLQTTGSERGAEAGRELEAGRLVERAVLASLVDGAGSGFVAERARREVGALERGPVRRALAMAVEGLDVADRGRVSHALVCYGGVLEERRRRLEAVEAFEAALDVDPESPELMLHAARAHRKAGNREAALALYRRVRLRGDARLRRFSEVGEALLDEFPDEALSRVLAEAESAGDEEAAGVALEERARLRRRGRTADAIEDYQAAALAYGDRGDRLRVTHALADVLLGCGDLAAAREALLGAVELADEGSRPHAVHRLRSVLRAQGDEVGLRRWRSTGASSLVSLMPAPRAASDACESSTRAAAVREWREALGA
ncbi:MAG: tetratricopeptide repeat protein [Gemmatimonadota bacterium]